MDTTEFIEFHRARVLRRTGKAPSPLTLKTKASALRVCCDATGLTDLGDLGTLIQDRERVESLLDALATRMTSGSMRTKVDALRDFGEFAKARGWCSSVALMPSDSPPMNPQKPITIYTDEELALILGAARAKGLRWWMFLETLASTGRRVGEVLGLEFAWLNTSAEPPHFHLPHTKNGRQAYVPLSGRLTAEVWSAVNVSALRSETREGRNRTFSRDVGTFPFPWTYTCIHRMFKRYLEALGVDHRSLHTLRHTRATNMLAKGVPLQAVSSLLGHANVATTDRIYNHANALAYSEYLE